MNRCSNDKKFAGITYTALLLTSNTYCMKICTSYVFVFRSDVRGIFIHDSKIQIDTTMWANAHRDGRPAEYRWRPLFNAAKFG